MGRVILVRHAMSDVKRGVASRLWGITEAAREDCVLLSHHLAATTAREVICSEEPKARETAEVLGLRLGLLVREDARVGEVDRPTTWDEDYRALAASYLCGAAFSAWEPRESVVKRFAAAIRETADDSDRDILVVNHGLALSLYLDSVATIDIVPFWQSLTFPDAWSFDRTDGSLHHLFDAGLPPPDA